MCVLKPSAWVKHETTGSPIPYIHPMLLSKSRRPRVNRGRSRHFPVVVQVLDDHGAPLKGISVRLLDSGRDESQSLDRRWMSQLEQPVQTDAFGCAIVYYCGRWTLPAQTPQPQQRAAREAAGMSSGR